MESTRRALVREGGQVCQRDAAKEDSQPLLALKTVVGAATAGPAAKECGQPQDAEDKETGFQLGTSKEHSPADTGSSLMISTADLGPWNYVSRFVLF